MKKTSILVYWMIVLLLLCGCAQEEVPAESGEAIFGSFTATDLNGNAVNEEIFQGHKLTMVNIWGTFCGPCINEMPDLGKLHSAYGEDFQVVGIVLDITDLNGNLLPDKKQDAVDIIEQTGADYLHLLPSPSLNEACLNEVQAIPHTIFVDENGKQVGQTFSGSRNHAQWKAIIDALLENVQ